MSRWRNRPAPPLADNPATLNILGDNISRATVVPLLVAKIFKVTENYYLIAITTVFFSGF